MLCLDEKTNLLHVLIDLMETYFLVNKKLMFSTLEYPHLLIL